MPSIAFAASRATIHYMDRHTQYIKQSQNFYEIRRHRTFFGHAIINEFGYEPTLIGAICVDKSGELVFTGSDDWYT